MERLVGKLFFTIPVVAAYLFDEGSFGSVWITVCLLVLLFFAWFEETSSRIVQKFFGINPRK